jgi:hypothetical protein
VAVQKEPFGEEFTVLSREVRGRHGVCVSRSKAYLNWRFLDGWSASHEVFAGRREGELVGYAVVAPEGSGARVVDLFAGDGEGVIADLIAGVTTELRTRGVETVSIWLSESHPWMGEVRGAGFVRRESSPVLVSPLARMSSHDGGPAWALTQGDRDS